MGLPQIAPLLTFKKEYNFYWQLVHIPEFSSPKSSNNYEKVKEVAEGYGKIGEHWDEMVNANNETHPVEVPVVTSPNTDYNRFGMNKGALDTIGTKTEQVGPSFLEKTANFFTALRDTIRDGTITTGKEIIELIRSGLHMQFNSQGWYVSQLAESINLPDDEIETEDYEVGTVIYKVPKRIKMTDISVTYLDDSANNVYMFHKNWQDAIKLSGRTMSMSPLAMMGCSGVYVSTDNSITEAEYLLMNSIQNESINDNFITGYLSNLTDNAFNVKGYEIYPRLVPTKITRGTMNKGGTGLSKCTVTYARLPVVNKHKPLRKYGNYMPS